MHDAAINYGCHFIAHNLSTSPLNTLNTGGYFEVNNGRTNYGVYSYAPTGDISLNNFAIYGDAPKASPIVGLAYTGFNVAVYGTAPTHGITIPLVANMGTWAGYFNGDLAYAGQLKNFSDSSLKTNIQPFNNAKGILSQLHTHTYYFDTVQYAGFMNFPKVLQYGIFAQELQLVAPALVDNTILPPHLDSLGNFLSPSVPVKMINTMGLIPILIQGFNEQQTTIDSLTQRLTDLENLVSNCCNITRPENTGERSNADIILQDHLTIILDQNRPNPFKDQTDINYTLPQEIKTASIIFYDRSGRVLNHVDLKDRGQGTIHIYAPDLSSGMYTYSLIADGKAIETKTMVKTK